MLYIILIDSDTLYIVIFISIVKIFEKTLSNTVSNKLSEIQIALGLEVHLFVYI